MTQLAAEHRAWRILLASFVTSAVLCGAIVYGVQWFVFQSTVQITTTATAARGTPTYAVLDPQQATAISDKSVEIEDGTTIQTDATSQAVISFTEPETGEPLAYLFVMRESKVRIIQAQAPRFEINVAPYDIRVQDSTGRSAMVIVAGSERPVQFTLTSPQGIMKTSTAGQYAIEVTDNWTKVSVQDGDVTLLSNQTTNPLHLAGNQHGYLAKNQQGVQHPAVDKSLVGNSHFTAIYSAGWKAYSEGDPAGTVANETFQGRPAVTIDRAQARWPNLVLDHGDTGLIQTINADVSNFDSLELQASFYVDEQSLSTCGIKGSECPLMVRVVYTDSGGVERDYIHGFYAFQDPAAGYPLLCDTCRAEHERVGMQTWYTYSDNLFALLPPEQRPQFIKEINFYASGHSYLIHVAQMDLVGSKLSPPDTTTN